MAVAAGCPPSVTGCGGKVVPARRGHFPGGILRLLGHQGKAPGLGLQLEVEQMKQIYPKPEMECFPRQSAGPLRAHGGFPYEELGGHVVVTSPCDEDAVRIRNAAVGFTPLLSSSRLKSPSLLFKPSPPPASSASKLQKRPFVF
ncbi:uncharacterized protein M6G45_012284 [Spheniscus humboldti]